MLTRPNLAGALAGPIMQDPGGVPKNTPSACGLGESELSPALPNVIKVM